MIMLITSIEETNEDEQGKPIRTISKLRFLITLLSESEMKENIIVN